MPPILKPPGSKSSFNWSSSDLSTLQQATSMSDSTPNYMKSTSSFVAKKENHRGGSESEDVHSVISSSCGSSSDTVVHPFTSISDETAIPQHSSSLDVQESSGYQQGKTWSAVNKGHFQGSICDSESSYDDSNDQTSSSRTSESYSVHYGRKPLHNTMRTTRNSTRNVRVLVKKASLKPRRNSLKSNQIVAGSHAEKETCSSTIKKNSRLSGDIELQSGQTEAERISSLKVCPYHHCSLNGHSHHDPPPKKDHHISSYVKRQSLEQQVSKKPWSQNKSKQKLPSGKKTGIKSHQISSSEDASVQQVDLVQRETIKAFYTEKGIVLETHLGSYNLKMDVDHSISPYVVAEQDGGENTASGSSVHEKNLTLPDEKEIFPDLKPDKAIAAGSAPDGDSEYEIKNQDRESETPVQNFHFNKGGHISMWHLIQKHMASENTKKPFQEASEDKQMEDAKTDLAKSSSDAYLEQSYSDIGIENQYLPNQEIEVRKLFAIKLVRNAIEKILLPEVQDQLSENQSITSDSVEDLEIPGEDRQAPSEGCNEGNGSSSTGHNTAADPRVLDQMKDKSLSVPDGKKLKTRLDKNSDKKSPSNWSNLKRWILLQRFVKELEKVRKLNPSKPRTVQLETGPESEKVNLRHQTVEERRRTEEWMLDYALQKVVGELAPTQKKKVALLVKAFETVVPPQDDRNIQIAAAVPKMKSEVHEDAFKRKNRDLSSTELKNKPDDCNSISVSKGRDTAEGHDRPMDADKQSSISPCLKLDSIIDSSEEVPGDAETEPNPTTDLIDNSKPISISQHTLADTTAQNIEHFANSTSDQQALEGDNPEFPPMDLKNTDKENKSCQSQLDRQNYIRMWHMVYQHVASAIATKVGSQLLGGEGEVEDLQCLSQGDTSVLLQEDHEAQSNVQSELSKIDAVKLVQEAVSEILEDTSDTHASETSLDPESPEDENREVEKQEIYSSPSLNNENINKIENGEGSDPDIVSTEGHTIAASTDRIKPYPQKVKNWRKLKQLMLLRRSIRAMEKARELKLQSQLLLSLPSDPQPEKIDLRQQMINERNKAEQWMLDYAVQHIVTKLTPARKRRVAMLVEAFEAVVPLPAV